MQVEDSQQEGILELNRVAAGQRAVHMLVGMDIQLVEELPDRNETYAGLLVLPLVVVQTCHLFYPFQSCAASACMHKPSNKPYQTNSSTTVTPLEVRYFQLSKLLWRIYTQIVGGRT